VEVNSSFYRRHRPATWQRWHDAVPDHFRFSLKLSKTITHERALIGAEAELDWFFEDVAPLKAKLGAVLIQLPPKLAFDAPSARSFLAGLRQKSAVPVFIEPRHVSWAEPEASTTLADFDVGRVLADPQLPELQSVAAGSRYLRLHGAPKIYYSAYTSEALTEYARVLSSTAQPAWCIFDNTASGAALRDAVRLRQMLER
jgi:uncharacterized protein YecE (DUF72 family)